MMHAATAADTVATSADDATAAAAAVLMVTYFGQSILISIDIDQSVLFNLNCK